MKNIIYIILIFFAGICISCEKEERIAIFEDTFQLSIMDYLDSKKDSFSLFIQIIEKGNLRNALSAYNPDGDGYTVFAPDNIAIEKLISESSQFSSINDILNNPAVAASFCRYHVVNLKARSNDFPFGAFSQPTLSGDYLIVSFVIEPDTAYYKINNQAPVSRPNIEMSNGFVHLVSRALEPVTFTSYSLLEQNPGISIFKNAIDLTGWSDSINFNLKVENKLAVTVLVEPDSIYNKRGIYSIQDLIARISPNNSDYTSPLNPLYNYVAYHFLAGNYYIDDFVNTNTNYNTYSEIPIRIDGRGLDVAINPGKEIFDTIIYQGDTTIVNYIKILYDQSNIVSQSGPIHFIDQIMLQYAPTRASTTYHFREEPVINKYYQEKGEFLIEENSLNRVKWSTGTDLFYVAGEEGSSNASNLDYLMITGDFNISYRIPRLVQGRYRVYLRAESLNAANAVVEVFIDRKKIGGMVDLSVGSTPTSPFRNIELGTIEFNRYAEHDIEIRALIPGQLLWDYFQFVPY